MEQKLISMTQKELLRYDVIKNLIDGKINGTDASKQLGLVVRHVKRLKVKVIESGAEGLIHGNRGKDSNRKLSDKIVRRARKHLKEKYYYFKPTLASEKLEENHNIKLGREKIRLMMTEMGLWKIKPRKQPKKRYTWRPRKDNYGEMQQFDGSYHNWFGDFETCLLLSADDATGKITHAKFDYNESVVAVFKFWLEYFDKNELPISIYLDKFSTYKVNHKNAVDNKDMITQFQRAANQTGVRLIVAHSPQAKGRVERMFGTLQDRLVKEMRLANIATMEQANEFLEDYIPRFNAKFAVAPDRRADLHKTISQSLKNKLRQIFSVWDIRKVNNDYTIRFENQYFQLNEEQPVAVYKKDTVTIEKHLNGDTKINFKGHYLNYTELPERPKKEININLPAITIRKQSNWKPPVNHPWRKQFLYDKFKTKQPILIQK